MVTKFAWATALVVGLAGCGAAPGATYHVLNGPGMSDGMGPSTGGGTGGVQGSSVGQGNWGEMGWGGNESSQRNSATFTRFGATSTLSTINSDTGQQTSYGPERAVDDNPNTQWVGS